MKNIAPNRLWNELEWSSLLRTGRVVLALGSTGGGRLRSIPLPVCAVWGDCGKSKSLLRRARFGMRFYFAPLHVDEMTQLALHRFKRVVDDFGNRFVRAVVLLFFVRDELVAA